MNGQQKTLLFLIMVLAVFLRFYQIQALPAGLFPDEAANGLDINLMQQGNLQPFYERGNGREALFFYMLWGSVEIFGKGPWQHHIVSAGVGVLGVLFCFLFTRRLFLIGARKKAQGKSNSSLTQVFSQNMLKVAQEVQGEPSNEQLDPVDTRRATNIAFIASFLMAANSWHVVLSRTAFRANLIPLFISLTFYLLLCAYQAKKRSHQLWLSFLTGASFGLGFYTYIAYRILVPIIIILVVWPIFARLRESGFFKGLRDVIREYTKHKLSFLVGFVLTIAPLAHYFYTHPDAFVGRSGQVSVFNPELNGGNLLGAIAEVFRLSIVAYFTQGDLNWRHNISGMPFLSQVVSPFFGVSLVVITVLAAWYIVAPAKRKYWWKYTVLAGLFWGMLVPVVTTAEGIPHGLRSIGTIPAVFIISAVGIYRFGEWVMSIHRRINKIPYKPETAEEILDDTFPLFRLKMVQIAFRVLIVSFCATIIAQTYIAYFVYAANSPEYAYSFRSDLTYVSNYLKQRCKKDSTYLILDKFSVQTTDYFTSDAKGNFSDKCSVPYKQVDPENSWELKGLKPDDEVVFTQSSIFDIKKFKQYHPTAHLTLEMRNKFGQAVLAVYKVSASEVVLSKVQNPDVVLSNDWLVYRNEEYGFELSYPEEWKSSGRDIKIGDSFTKPPEIGVFEVSLKDSKQDIQAIAAQEIKENNCAPWDHVIRSGSLGILYTLSCSATSEDYIYLTELPSGKKLQLLYHDDFDMGWTEEQKLQVFEQIIRSFRVLP